MATDADIIRRLTNEVFIGGNLELIDELFAEDFVDHDPIPGTAPDKAGQRAAAQMIIAAFSDRRIEMDDFVETVDGRVVESWLFCGAHTGDFAGLPPSNQSVTVRGIEIWRCADGKVTEHWGAVDMGDVFEKAGA